MPTLLNTGTKDIPLQFAKQLSEKGINIISGLATRNR